MRRTHLSEGRELGEEASPEAVGSALERLCVAPLGAEPGEKRGTEDEDAPELPGRDDESEEEDAQPESTEERIEAFLVELERVREEPRQELYAEAPRARSPAQRVQSHRAVR